MAMALPSTDEQVADLALLYCGSTETTTDLDSPTSLEETVISKVYLLVLHETLRDLRPQFARRRTNLVESTSIDNDEWDYGYTVPASMVVPLYLESEGRGASRDSRIEFVKEYDQNDGDLRIYTNVEATNASLVYIHLETDMAKWDEWFVNAFAWALAERIASMLGVSPERRADIRAQAMFWRGEAHKAEDESQVQPPPQLAREHQVR